MTEIVLSVIDISKTASVVILFVMLVRLLLKRSPKIFSYALWSVVLIRMLIPMNIPAAFGVVPQMDSVVLDYTLADDPISFVGASQAVIHAVGDVFDGEIEIQQVPTIITGTDGEPDSVSSQWWEVWVLFLKFVWPIGLAVFVGYSLYNYRSLRGKVKDAVEVKERIYLADHIVSPFVMGLFRPKIYLPSSLDKSERKYILLHELHHIERWDHVIKMIAFILLCIHWFNPLVWLAFILMSRDMEMSCDEAVISTLGTEVCADYSASLLSLATGQRIIAGTPLAFGEGDTKGRIRNLARWKSPTQRKVLLALVLFLASFICFLTNSGTGYAGLGTTPENVVFGSTWEVEKIIYGNTVRTDPAEYKYCISKEGRLTLSEGGVAVSELEEILQFMEISLNRRVFDEVFSGNVSTWTQGIDLARTIRKNNARAWSIRLDHSERGPMMYYLLQQKDGTVYLLQGRYDKGNLGDWFDDTSSFWWMCELQRCEPSGQTSEPDSKGVIMLDAEIWPKNDYTEDIREPLTGKVAGGYIDQEENYCYLVIDGIKESDYYAITSGLKGNGYAELVYEAGELPEGNFITNGRRLTDGNKMVSILYSEGRVGIMISFLEK